MVAEGLALVDFAGRQASESNLPPRVFFPLAVSIQKFPLKARRVALSICAGDRVHEPSKCAAWVTKFSLLGKCFETWIETGSVSMPEMFTRPGGSEIRGCTFLHRHFALFFAHSVHFITKKVNIHAFMAQSFRLSFQ